MTNNENPSAGLGAVETSATAIGPIACTLTTREAASQSQEWRTLQQRASEVRPIAGGARMALPLELASIAQDLAARECQCCSFLDITVAVAPGAPAGEVEPSGDAGAEPEAGVVVDITSQHPDAGPVIGLISGLNLEGWTPLPFVDPPDSVDVADPADAVNTVDAAGAPEAGGCCSPTDGGGCC